MDRDFEVKDAVMRELERLGIQPYKPVNLEYLGYPLIAKGFSQAEILKALHDLIDTEVLKRMPGNRVCVAHKR